MQKKSVDITSLFLLSCATTGRSESGCRRSPSPPPASTLVLVVAPFTSIACYDLSKTMI